MWSYDTNIESVSSKKQEARVSPSLLLIYKFVVNYFRLALM